MKWLIVIIFSAALFGTLFWYESDERKFTRPQQLAVGLCALAGWALVVILSATIL